MPHSLLSIIKSVPEERDFLVTDNSIFKYKDIVNISNTVEKNHPDLNGKNCAVVSQDRESLAIYLPVFDFLCDRVFLLPNDLSQSEKSLCSIAEIDYVIRISHGNIVHIDPLDISESKEKGSSQEEGKECEYLIATSGTTGEPKLASYNLVSLTATTKKDIAKGQFFRWGLCYDINRFAGLQVYLQAISSGSMLVVGRRGESIDSLVSTFANNGVNCLSATPSFFRQLLMSPHHQNIPLTKATLGGEISHQNILNAIKKGFKGVRLIHIYASTEAGVGFSVKDGKEGFPLSFLSDDENCGISLKIAQGMLWIKSKRGCSRFLKGTLGVDEDGFIRTGDLVRIEGNRVYFLGRDNGSINVGGNKVMPEKVETVLEASKYVLLSKVSAKKNPVLGSLVVAEIELSQSGKELDNKELKSEIIKFCRTKLESFELPALLRFVESIEVNSIGKKVRRRD